MPRSARTWLAACRAMCQGSVPGKSGRLKTMGLEKSGRNWTPEIWLAPEAAIAKMSMASPPLSSHSPGTTRTSADTSPPGHTSGSPTGASPAPDSPVTTLCSSTPASLRSATTPITSGGESAPGIGGFGSGSSHAPPPGASTGTQPQKRPRQVLPRVASTRNVITRPWYPTAAGWVDASYAAEPSSSCARTPPSLNAG